MDEGDELYHFATEPIPRTVPPELARRARGPWWTLMPGLLIFSGGLFFTILFVPTHLLEEHALKGTNARTTDGVIETVEYANLSVNHKAVMAYRFRYAPNDSGVRTGVCYATGKVGSPEQAVTVRYLPAQPAVARIEACRLDKTGPESLWIAVNPLVGLGLIGGALGGIRQRLWLLRNGQMASAEVVAAEPTSVRINRRPVHSCNLAARSSP